MPKKPELKALTSLRGIAAMFVMFHHFMFVAMVDVAAWVPSWLFLKSYLWVDLFFILSGFVIAYVYQTVFQTGVAAKPYLSFMQSRFARVYPLHLFTLMLLVAMESLQWLLGHFGAAGAENLPPPFTGDEGIGPLITNLLLVQTFHWSSYWNEPAWSISAEWITYFIIPFLLHRLLALPLNRLAVTAALAMVPLVLIEWYFGDLGLYYAGWPMLVRCFCEATLGILVFRSFQAGLFNRIGAPDLTILAFLTNILLLALPGPGVISVAGFVWLVLCASRLPQQQNHILNHRLLVYLGKISYSIYLVHWVVMLIFMNGVRYSMGIPINEALSLQDQLLWMAAMIAVVLVISHFTYLFIERPLRERLKPRANNATTVIAG